MPRIERYYDWPETKGAPWKVEVKHKGNDVVIANSMSPDEVEVEVAPLKEYEDTRLFYLPVDALVKSVQKMGYTVTKGGPQPERRGKEPKAGI